MSGSQRVWIFCYLACWRGCPIQKTSGKHEFTGSRKKFESTKKSNFFPFKLFSSKYLLGSNGFMGATSETELSYWTMQRYWTE